MAIVRLRSGPRAEAAPRRRRAAAARTRAAAAAARTGARAGPAPKPPHRPCRRSRWRRKALFDFDKAVLRARRQAPRSTTRSSRSCQVQKLELVLVTGHTDRIGTQQYNQRLSERRADAVRDYLVSKGVPKDRIETLGMGKTQPVPGVVCNQKNMKELIACLAPNRRVEVEVKGEGARANATRFREKPRVAGLFFARAKVRPASPGDRVSVLHRGLRSADASSRLAVDASCADAPRRPRIDAQLDRPGRAGGRARPDTSCSSTAAGSSRVVPAAAADARVRCRASASTLDRARRCCPASSTRTRTRR